MGSKVATTLGFLDSEGHEVRENYDFFQKLQLFDNFDRISVNY